MRGKPPSILAQNGLSLLGTTATTSQNPFEKVNKLAATRKDSAGPRKGAKNGLGGANDTDRSFYPNPKDN